MLLLSFSWRGGEGPGMELCKVLIWRESIFECLKGYDLFKSFIYLFIWFFDASRWGYINYIQYIFIIFLLGACVCSVTQSCLMPIKIKDRVRVSHTGTGLPFPSPGDLSDPGIKPRPPALQADLFTYWATRESLGRVSYSYYHTGTGAHQAPLSMGFLRQEYWSRLPFPSLGYPSNPGIEPTLAGGFFTTVPPEKPPFFLFFCLPRHHIIFSIHCFGFEFIHTFCVSCLGKIL